MVKKILLSLLVFMFMISTGEAANLANRAEIQSIRYDYGAGTVRIILDLTKKIDYQETSAENPSRSVIYIKNAWIDSDDEIEEKLESTAAKRMTIRQVNQNTVVFTVETMAAIHVFGREGGPSGYRLFIDVGNAPFQKTV